MSHELLDIDNETNFDWGDSITSSATDYKYFYVPSIPDWAYNEFDGLLYEGKQYNWNEVDYRLTVEYSSVPEPSTIGFIMGAALLILVLFKKK